MAHQRCLAGDTLPLAILANPSVGKTAGPDHRLSFDFDPLVVVAGNHGGVAVDVGLHSRVAQLLILIDFVSDVRQPLAPVHKASIDVGIGKWIPDQHAHSFDIMDGFGLVPGIFEGENSALVIVIVIVGQPVVFNARSVLGVDIETHRQQDTASNHAS